jgi:hypothetical protein
MVDVVGRVPRPRLGLNGARPIAERWTEAIDELHRIAPGVPFGQPISEMNLDRLYDLISEHRKAKAPPPMDPQTREAASELYRLKMLFNGCSLEIKDSQKWLQFAHTDWRHKLLGDITADCFVSVGVYPTSVSESPRFANAIEAREAVREMHPRLQWVRAIASQISSARAFENLPPAEQSIRLMRALAAKQAEDEARIVALEAACMALQAQVGRLESKKSKPKKSMRSKSSKALDKRSGAKAS